jgi:hypothetical protein
MAVKLPAKLTVSRNGIAAGKLVRYSPSSSSTPPPTSTDPTTPTTAAGTHILQRATSAQPQSFRRLEAPFWSTPLAVDAPVHRSSARYVTALIAQLTGTTKTTPFTTSYDRPFNTITQTGNYSAPTYTVPSNQALQKVYVQDNKTVFVNGVSTDLKTLFDQGVPVPDPTLISSGTLAADGTDGHVMFFQTYTAADGVQTARLFEFWQFRPAYSSEQANGYNWRCVQGGYIADIRYHSGWWTGSDQDVVGGNWGVSASGASYANATLTGRDWARFKAGLPLDHPLILQIIFSGGQPEDLASGSYAGGQFHLPACRYDHMDTTGHANSESYRIPEGTRYRLDPATWTDTAIASYAAANAASNTANGAPADQLAWFLKGMRSHGLIAAETAGVMAIVAEHPKTFGTIYNPYTDIPVWGNVLQQFPTTGVVAVRSPVARIDFPTGGPTTAPQDEVYDYSLAPVPSSAKVNQLPSSIYAPTTTSGLGTHGSGQAFALNTGYQPEGVNAVTVTYSSPSSDSGVALPRIACASGDRIGVRVFVKRHKGSSRLKVNMKWRKPDGSALAETLGPYITRVLETEEVHEFVLTAPQSVTVGYCYPVIRSVYDTPSSGDSFSFGAPQVWAVSKAVTA